VVLISKETYSSIDFKRNW